MTTPTLKELFRGYKRQFDMGLEAADESVNALHKNFATVLQSTRRSEVYPWLDDVQKMRKWEGDRKIHKVGSGTFEVFNEDYETTLEIKKNDVADANTAILPLQFRGLGTAVREWPNDMAFDVLRDGENIGGYDDEALFSTSHPVKDADGSSVVASNYIAGAGEPWYLVDDTKMIKAVLVQIRQTENLVRKDRETDDNMFYNGKAIYGVDTRGAAAPGAWYTAFKSRAALNQAAYQSARAVMKGYRNNQGRLLGVRPRILMTTAANESAARELIKAEYLANGASNVDAGDVRLVITDLLDQQ